MQPRNVKALFESKDIKPNILKMKDAAKKLVKAIAQADQKAIDVAHTHLRKLHDEIAMFFSEGRKERQNPDFIGSSLTSSVAANKKQDNVLLSCIRDWIMESLEADVFSDGLYTPKPFSKQFQKYTIHASIRNQDAERIYAIIHNLSDCIRKLGADDLIHSPFFFMRDRNETNFTLSHFLSIKFISNQPNAESLNVVLYALNHLREHPEKTRLIPVTAFFCNLIGSDEENILVYDKSYTAIYDLQEALLDYKPGSSEREQIESILACIKANSPYYFKQGEVTISSATGKPTSYAQTSRLLSQASESKSVSQIVHIASEQSPISEKKSSPSEIPVVSKLESVVEYSTNATVPVVSRPSF